jgi:hypothetical protein
MPTQDTHDAHAHTGAGAPIAPVPVPRSKIIDSLKNKNGAWDALIHGSFS